MSHDDVFRAVKLEDAAFLRNWLLQNNPNITDSSKKMSTLLHWACYLGSRDVAALFLDNGADINAKETDGKTPIHWAAFEGYHAVVVLLLQHGAECQCVDSLKKTPCELALMNGHIDVARLFPNFRDCVLSTAAFDHYKEQLRDWPVNNSAGAAPTEDMEVVEATTAKPVTPILTASRPTLVPPDLGNSRQVSPPAAIPYLDSRDVEFQQQPKKEKKDKKDKKEKTHRTSTMCTVEVQTDQFGSCDETGSVTDSTVNPSVQSRRLIPRSEKIRRKEERRLLKEIERQQRRESRRAERARAKADRRKIWLDEVEREAVRIAATASPAPEGSVYTDGHRSRSIDLKFRRQSAATAEDVDGQSATQPSVSQRRSRSAPRNATRQPWRPPSDPSGKIWSKYGF